MNVVNCPVCQQEHDVNEMCPVCGFEIHLLLQSEDTAMQEFEEQRLAKAREIWGSRKELLAAKKPLAFLVTEQLTAYCVYDGENSFGSAKVNAQCTQHQKIIAGNCLMRPAHFAITTVPAGKRFEFNISELSAGEPSVFVNNLNVPAAGGVSLSDNDDILIQSEGGNAKIKFRVNLN